MPYAPIYSWNFLCLEKVPIMKSFLKLRNFAFHRFKSSSSNGKTDKQTLIRLDHESNLLFGKPQKIDRRRTRKKMKWNLAEDSEETIYYDVLSKEPSLSTRISKSNSDINENRDFEKIGSPLITDINISSEINEGNHLSQPSTCESTEIFPLFNEAKKEYVTSQNYRINSFRISDSQEYPTVTAVLNETMSTKAKTHLNQWKANQVEELGQEKFDDLQKMQLQSKKVLLKLIQKRLNGVPNEDLNIEPEFQGCWKSLDCVFPLFSKLVAIEKMTVHSELKYKGMIDSIIEFKNKPVLVSWKKSSKIKSSISMTFDAPIQIAAYMGALNFDKNYPFKIEESLLVMSYEDGSKADIFHLKKENCFYYWKMWLERLQLFHLLHKKSNDKNRSVGKIEVESSAINDSISPPSTGFVNSAYSTFTEVTAKRTKKSKEEFQVIFPMYNDRKKEYVPGFAYESNPVKLDIHSYYPSVTTILGETRSDSSKFVLKRWKDNLVAEMGEEGFENYQKNLLETGTLLHKLIQQRLLGIADNDLTITPQLEGCWKSLQAVFPLFSDIKFTESYVVHKELKYKGIIDCVAEFRGKPVLIDWKKSDKVKASIDNTYDAPLQVAAYIAATNYDDNYPFKIEEGLLIISYIDGTKADIFHLNKQNCLKYWSLWLQRLLKYQTEAKAKDLRIDY